MEGKRRPKKNFIERHSLSLTASAILLCWIGLYIKSDPSTHWGSFFGNAIADWSGVVVTILATKYLYEKNSAESRQCPEDDGTAPVREFFRDHGLTIFLIATGAFWVALYLRLDPNARWGQVVGNIVSEWTQILGLVVMTKKLIEPHAKL
jgi:hypothetical protein